MNATDQRKLLAQGWVIIRRNSMTQTAGTTTASGHVIKAKDPTRHEWYVLERNFVSKAARGRRVETLLAKPKTVED